MIPSTPEATAIPGPPWDSATGARAGVSPFAVGLLLGSIMLTWLYNSTGGSVMATAVMVWAIALVLMTGAATLSRSSKVVWRPATTGSGTSTEREPLQPV